MYMMANNGRSKGPCCKSARCQIAVRHRLGLPVYSISLQEIMKGLTQPWKVAYESEWNLVETTLEFVSRFSNIPARSRL